MPNHYTNILIMSGYADDYKDTFDAAKFCEEHAKTNWCEVVKPVYGPNPNATCEEQQEAWGVKWGTYDTKCMNTGGDGNVHVITFCSPWGPPTIIHDIAMYIRKLCGFERFAILGFDPYDGETTALANIGGVEEFGIE
jgi:hypothetical protein